MNDIQPRLVLRIPMYPGESWELFGTLGVHNYDEDFRLVEDICREYLGNQQIEDNFLFPRLLKTMSFLGTLTWVSEQQVYEATVHRFAPTLTPFSHPITSIEFPDGVSRPVLEATKRHQFVVPHEARFCPLCLREQPFHKLEWSLNLILACRKHQCLLANCCPACGSGLTIQAIANTECHKCHASLLKTHITSLRNDILGLYTQETLASWLAGEVETESRDLLEIPDVSARAAYTFVYGLVRSMRKREIGQALHSPAISWKAQNKRTFRPNFELYHKYQVVTTALKAVTNWPRSFYEFLDHYRVLPERWLSGGLQSHFGLLYHLLQREWAIPEMERVQAAFDDYVLDRYGDSYNIKLSARYTCRRAFAERFQYLTYAEAGVLLGVEPRTLTRLAELHRINRYRSNDSQHWLFSKPEIQALNETWTRAISLEKACDLLGLPRNLVDRLIDDGFIRAERGPGVDESPEWKLDIRHVEAYLFQVTSRLQPIEANQSELIDFSAVIRMLTVLGMNDLSTLEAIRQAELVAYRPLTVDDTQLRLDSILFLEDEVLKFIETVKKKRRWVDRASICRLMGVKDVVLDSWIHNHLIAPVQTIASVQYFDVDEVEKFAANFVFTEQAARLLSLSRLTLQRWALNGRLHPVSGPHIDVGHDYLFRRSEIRAWQVGIYLTAPALASYLRISHSQLLQWVKAGKIRPISGPGVDQSKHYRFALTEAVYGLRRHVSE